METALWLVLIQGIGVAVVAAALLALALFMKSLIDKLIATVEAVRVKVDSIDNEIKPILRDVEQLLKEVEPLARELGERGAQIGTMIENIQKVTDDAQATTGAIRTGVVPIAHALSGLFAGFVEGGKALGDYTRRGR